MKQKNTIDGSDIAELLLKDRKDIHLPYASTARKERNVDKVSLFFRPQSEQIKLVSPQAAQLGIL